MKPGDSDPAGVRTLWLGTYGNGALAAADAALYRAKEEGRNQAVLAP